MTKALSRLALLVALLTTVASAQQLERALKVIGSRFTLTKPTQLAVSPSGSRFAVVDQFANRILVCESGGELEWWIGEPTRIEMPTAVCFDGENALLFACKGRQVILRASQKDPQRIDTVAMLVGKLPRLRGIDALIRLPNKSFLILDESASLVLAASPDWKSLRVVVDEGRGNGKLWLPTDIAVDLADNMILLDSGSPPVQFFASTGKHLYYAGWNRPVSEPVWQATAAFVTLDQYIWVADVNGRQWRIYDRAGNELERRPFDPVLTRPLAAAVTSDNRLIVLDEKGLLVIFSLI